VQKDGFAVIDGTLDIEEQQNRMRKQVGRFLPPRTPPNVEVGMKEARSG
jgi:hypothetical protein